MKTLLIFILGLSSAAGLAAQTSGCAISLSSSGAALPYIGTSTNGFLPSTTMSFTATVTAACGSAPLTVSVTYPPAGLCGEASGGWLSVALSGSTVTFSAFSNTGSFARSATITVANGIAAPQTYTVTEVANTTDNVSARVVRAIYQQVLGREPDAGGFAFWNGPGAIGLGPLADAFLTSAEATNTDFAAIAMHQAIKGALPTFAQYSAAVSTARAGGAAAAFDALMDGSPFDANFVTALYQNLLGRTPTALELTAALSDPSGAYGAFAAILTSPEFQNTGLFHTPATPDHSNRMYLQLLYFTLLGRDADVGGFQFWLNVVNSGGPGVYFQPRNSTAAALRLQILYPPYSGGFLHSVLFCPILM